MVDKPENFLSCKVTVKVDRPLGSKHPKFEKTIYPLNYGFIPNTVSGDGKEVDVYILGVDRPLNEFEGTCFAYIVRADDDDPKLLVCREGKSYSDEEIWEMVNFQEKYFDSRIV